MKKVPFIKFILRLFHCSIRISLLTHTARNSRKSCWDMSMKMAFSAVRTRGTKVLFPMELFPVYFLVILIGSQFRTFESRVRKVVPSEDK